MGFVRSVSVYSWKRESGIGKRDSAGESGGDEMAKKNDGMRGTWHFTGTYWYCDCYGGGPLLRIHVGQGGSLSPGMAHSPSVNKCGRCGVYRPLARDRPELGNALPHGIKRVVRGKVIE